MARTSDALDNLVVGSCTDLFAAYGVALDRRESAVLASKADSPEASAGGMVHFSGDALSGSLLMAACFSFLADCRPERLRTKELSMSSASDWILVRDWAMELSNQLVGRLRNRLYDYGVALEIRGPTALSAHPLAITIAGRKAAPLLFAAANNRLLRVWVDATTSPNFDLAMARKPISGSVSAKEKDVLLF